MCSTYRCKDVRRGFDTDVNTDWLIENILYKPCFYCGTTDHVGADRIDNTKGHLKENLLPCCVVCNMVRGRSFSVDEMKQLGALIAQIKKDREK